MSNEDGVIEPFKVYIRIRPFNDKELQGHEKQGQISNYNRRNQEKEKAKSIILAEDNLLFVLDPISLELNGRKEKSYVFDNIFSEDYNNERIFNVSIRPIIDNLLRGYNSTALAYGVTGTGKTHTMFGGIACFANDEGCYEETDRGVCLYAVDYLFDKINLNDDTTYNVKISYLEIYNEHVIDLLVPKSQSLMIVEDSVKGIVVPDLTEYDVNNSADLIKLIIEGNSRRTMAATNKNHFSSRSHAILQVVVEQRNKVRDTKEELIFSKLLIVDLAGSERGGLEKGPRREEGSNINKSLLSLGNCINLLSDQAKKGAFIPYRDSKLTRMLKDSLGGNILTVMISCVSPSYLTYDETINTLNYSSRARKIQKKVTRNIKEVNVHISQYKEIIDSLKNEIQQLKGIIENQQRILEGYTGKVSQYAGIEKEEISDDKPNNQQMLSRSTVFNSNGQYLMTGKDQPSYPPTQTSCGHIPHTKKYLNLQEKTPQSITLDMYKNFLERKGEFSIDTLLKQIDSLQNDQRILEEFLATSRVHDKAVIEKYKIVRNYAEQYLELINDQLVENIEQNMILKINLNEIAELNATNNANLKVLYSQILSMEKLKLEVITNGTEIEVLDCENEIRRLKEEMANIQSAMTENEQIKDKISESLEENVKVKQILKTTLLSLVSSSKPGWKYPQTTKNDGAYQSLLKEKEELERKNQKFENALKTILKEKQHKDSQLNEVQKELTMLKLQIGEKTGKIKDFHSHHKTEKEKEEDKAIKEKNKKIECVENLNLHEDYFLKKSTIQTEECQTQPSHPLKTASNEVMTSVQNIKYLISQTNNIVNTNINRVMGRESMKNLMVLTGDSSSDGCKKKKKYSQQKVDDTNMDTYKPQTKLLKRKNSDVNVRKVNDAHKRIMRSMSRSPHVEIKKKNKFQEFDKIIENQLNEVYNKKAKEIGDKMKKKYTGSKKNLNLKKENISGNIFNNNLLNNYNNMLNQLDNLNYPNGRNGQAIAYNENTAKNKSNLINPIVNTNTSSKRATKPPSQLSSLSISCVSYNNEAGFNSEMDFIENFQAQHLQEKAKRHTHGSTAKIVEALPPQEKLMISTNKNLNIKKFLNVCPAGVYTNHNNQNLNLNFVSFPIKDKQQTALPNRRDYSAMGLLQQARIEKQLKTQLRENCATSSGNSNSNLNLNYNINSNSNQAAVDIFIKNSIPKTNSYSRQIKRTEEFINDYTKTKRTSTQTDDSTNTNPKPTNRTENMNLNTKRKKRKGVLSIIDVEDNTDGNSNINDKNFEEKESNECSQKEFMNSIDESVKRKLIKYIEKKSY